MEHPQNIDALTLHTIRHPAGCTHDDLRSRAGHPTGATQVGAVGQAGNAAFGGQNPARSGLRRILSDVDGAFLEGSQSTAPHPQWSAGHHRHGDSHAGSGINREGDFRCVHEGVDRHFRSTFCCEWPKILPVTRNGAGIALYCRRPNLPWCP